MSKSRNRLFAEWLSDSYSSISSTYAGEGTDSQELTIDTFGKTIQSEGNTAIDTISAGSVSAVTYRVVASKNGYYNYSTISAVKNSGGSMDYTEYGTILNNNTSLGEYSVELENGNIILTANNHHSSFKIPRTGKHKVCLNLPKLFFNEGTFFVDFGLTKKGSKIFGKKDVLSFIVLPEIKKVGEWMGKEPGPIKMIIEWNSELIND